MFLVFVFKLKDNFYVTNVENYGNEETYYWFYWQSISGQWQWEIQSLYQTGNRSLESLVEWRYTSEILVTIQYYDTKHRVFFKLSFI